MLEMIANASLIQKGLFIMVTGISGVFAVLILFYLLIKLFSMMINEKEG